MITAKLKILKGPRYAAVRRLAPIDAPKTALAELLQELSTGTASIKIDKLFSPSLEDFSIVESVSVVGQDLLFQYPLSESIDLDTLSLLIPPTIQNVQLLTRPQRAGKSYNDEKEQLRLELSPDNSISEPVSTRPNSRKNRPQPKDRRAIFVDLFDLIFPILQPRVLQGPQQNTFLHSDLKSWQPEGIRFLVQNESALLADDMGLGKTVQTIVAMKILFQQGLIKTGIIVCPKSLIGPWERELGKWAEELYVVRVEGDKYTRPSQWDTRAHLHIANYETLTRDFIIEPYESAIQQRFDLCVLDEIQRIKNASKTSNACKSLNAKRRWGLSGTPLENQASDIVNIFNFLKPDLFGAIKEPSKTLIKSKIEPLTLRRRASDLKEMPEVIWDETYLDLLPNQRSVYDLAEQRGVVELKNLGETITVTHVLQLITRLKKICNLEEQSHESIKLEYLRDVLDEITDQGNKALVFSQYPNETLQKIMPELNKFRPELYQGSLSNAERDRKVNHFQNGDENKVLLMSLKSGGVGLTLTRANYVFLFDHWWNPAVMKQAVGRAARIGQEKTVFVRSLIIRNSIEEKIQQILRDKQTTFDEIVDDLSDDALQQRLSEDELFSLFGLSKKPVSSVRLLDNLHWAGFEDLVGKLYEQMGFKTEVTKRSGDHGIDVYATRHTSDGGKETLAIQCKHYPGRTVGEPEATSLWGAIYADHKISRGVLVTTGKFSKQCKDFVEGKRIRLIERGELEMLLRTYKLS